MSESELFDEIVWSNWTEDEETQAEHDAYDEMRLPSGRRYTIETTEE